MTAWQLLAMDFARVHRRDHVVRRRIASRGRLDVAAAAEALVRGSFGSWYAFGSGTLVRATPLILTGLAVAIAFRAGVFNIGAEGQFLVGAAGGTAVALVHFRARRRC